MPPDSGPDEDDVPAQHRRGRDIYKRIVEEVQRDLKAGRKATSVAAEVLERIDALAPDDRDAVNGYLEAMAANKSPGFHERGLH